MRCCAMQAAFASLMAADGWAATLHANGSVTPAYTVAPAAPSGPSGAAGAERWAVEVLGNASDAECVT